MKFRKRPVIIEAMQLVGTNAETHAVYQWIEANTQGSFDPLSEEIPASGVSIDPATGFFLIATLEGVMQAKPGDWIIRDIKGEFYPIKPNVFADSYEEVSKRKPALNARKKNRLRRSIYRNQGVVRGNQHHGARRVPRISPRHTTLRTLKRRRPRIERGLRAIGTAYANIRSRQPMVSMVANTTHSRRCA